MCFSWRDWFPSETISQTLVSSDGQGEIQHLAMNIQDWVPALAYESHLSTATEYRGTFFSPSKFNVLFYTGHSFFEGERPGNTNWCHSFFTLFGPAFTLWEDCLILDGFWGTDVLFVLQFVWPLFKHLLGAQSPMAPCWQHIESVCAHFTAPQYISLWFLRCPFLIACTVF